VVVHTKGGIDSAISDAGARSVIFLNPQIDPIPMISGYQKEHLYCLLPDWVRLFNFNDWQSRSFIWTIYRLHSGDRNGKVQVVPQ
jgi:hypothetical protein